MRKKKILIVDDEMVMRAMLRDYLSMFDYDVITAENGMIAWEKWNTNSPDILITDINMPIMSGLELLYKVKSLAPEFPIIIITGVNVDQARKSAADSRADAFLAKPFKMAELAEMVKVFLRN